jgi:hypothetical protein
MKILPQLSAPDAKLNILTCLVKPSPTDYPAGLILACLPWLNRDGKEIMGRNWDMVRCEKTVSMAKIAGFCLVLCAMAVAIKGQKLGR